MTKPGIVNDESDDLTQEELEEICREVEEEFERNGIPSDAELMAEIEKLNASAPAKRTDLGDLLATALGHARRGNAKLH